MLWLQEFFLLIFRLTTFQNVSYLILEQWKHEELLKAKGSE